MKKILKVLAAIATGVLISFAFMSCEVQETCGYVQGFNSNSIGEYFLIIDGNYHSVNVGTWVKTEIGEYVCLYN